MVGIKIQIILLWSAVVLYVMASIAYAWKLVNYSRSDEKSDGESIVLAEKDKISGKNFLWGIIFTIVGLIPHSGALLLRWLEAGHGPYMRRYEVYSSDVWIVVVMYLLAQARWPRLRFTGVIILPSSFLLIGMAVMASPEISPLPATFGTFWLIVHILFAKLTYGGFLIGTSLAVFYLIRDKAERRGDCPGYLKLLPGLEILNEQSYHFISFGFMMQAIMIASGAIWANKAWGSYWSWDPVETWSLISWLLYGIYLHLVRTYGWSGRRPAWLALASVFILMFALFGVGLIYQSLHSPYLR